MSDNFNNFAQELEQFLDFDTPQVGDIRHGTIVSISPQGAIVALDNLKRDGIVQLSDLNKLEENERAALQVDQLISVKVVNTDDPDNLYVSIYEAWIIEDWKRAEELKESGEFINVEVSGYNKGGLTAPFGRLRGFIPLSQVSGFNRNLDDRERQRRMAKMRGQEIPVKIIEVDQERRRLVFSEREGAKEREDNLKQGFLTDLKPGDILKGRVRSIRDFGVFVDLGIADGLVHVSELAWHRIKHPKEVVRVGEEIEVQVLKVDPESQRVSLSRRPLLVNPWTVIHERYREGQLVEGVVMRIADYGAFVELEPGVEGLLHITQLSKVPVKTVEEIVQVGERHLLRVLTVDSDRQRIRLSLKAVSANEQIEWMTRRPETPPAPTKRVRGEKPAAAPKPSPASEVAELDDLALGMVSEALVEPVAIPDVETVEPATVVTQAPETVVDSAVETVESVVDDAPEK